MLLDVSPLVRHRDFRLVYAGQAVSAFGSFLTYVALPVQVYDLTKSSLLVGMLGTVQLVPLALTALWGGAYADALDRRRLLVVSELLLALGAAALAGNALLPHPSVVACFLVAGFMSAVNGFHRPALESLTPKLVPREELTAAAALNSLRGTTASVAGPALSGICIAHFGLGTTFALDAVTYLAALVAIAAIRAMPPAEGTQAPGFRSIVQGLSYAGSRPELIGTYVVDIVAMTFAMPMALFPALADGWGGTAASGWLYSGMSIGSLAITLFSGWTSKVVRHGAAVIIAASLWGVGIIGLGFAHSLPVAVLCLALAGAADMVSALFRMTMWNETIPSNLRGRLAGIEQLSYMSGPLLGNARAGFVAQGFGVEAAIVSGGLMCVAGVLACVPLLPAFWRYRRLEEAVPATEPAA